MGKSKGMESMLSLQKHKAWNLCYPSYPNFWPGRMYCRPWRFKVAQQQRPPQQQQQSQQPNRVGIMHQQQITLPQPQPQQQNRVSIMHQQQINSMLRAARQNPHAYHNSGACQNSALESDITRHVSSDSDWETSGAAPLSKVCCHL